MKNIVILISGRGSNMQAIVRANIPNAKIVAIISNQENASGLVWAKEQGLTTDTLSHKAFTSREDFDQALIEKIDTYKPDLVVLAGFMRVLTAPFCRHYAGRLINIHPSLLPSFTGLDTHKRAIEAGCKVAGCTVHFVTEELDAGAMIAQAVVPILSGDTPDTLAQRVLSCEHQIYPQVVADFVLGYLKIEQGKVINTHSTTDKNSSLLAWG